MLNLVSFKQVGDGPYYIHETAPVVYKLVDGEYHQLQIHKSGYLKVYDNFVDKYLTFHRLRAIAFIPLPDGLILSNAICNHLNGNKYDNAISNLEWTTYRGNNIHAIITGLRQECVTGECIDLVTGTSYEFYSLWDLSRMIDYHAGMIQKYLSSDKDYPFKNRYQITVTGKTPKGFTIHDIWKSGPGSPTPVKVINTVTGESKIYGTFANMSRLIGRGWIWKKKLVPGKVLKFDEYTVELVTRYRDIMEGHKENDEYAKLCYRGIINSRPQPNKVSVTFPDGRVEIYTSLKVLSITLGVTYSALKKRMSKYNGRHKDLTIRYL